MPGVRRFLRILLNALTLLSLAVALPLGVVMLPFCCFFNPDANVLIWSFDAPAGGRTTQWQLDDHDETLVPVIRTNFKPGTSTSEADYVAIYVIRAASVHAKGNNFVLLIIKLWPIFLVTAVLPTLTAPRTLRRVVTAIKARGRRRAGLCPTCGYDLRATPDRCPECGIVPSKGRAPAPEGGRR